MIVLGIDPGLSGGWALIDHNGDYRGGGRMPKKPYGKKFMVDGRALHTAISAKRYGEAEVAVIEHVHSMPEQGVASSFSFGLNTGVAHGVAADKAGDTIIVTPQKWKKHFGLSSDKRASLDLAAERWFLEEAWGVLANDGIAEAALMALWYVETQLEA